MRLPPLMTSRQVLPAPILVNLRVERYLPHADAGEHPCKRDAEHGLPNDLESFSKGVLHLLFERLLQRRDERDSRKGDLGALRELLEERRR